ncbi:MAG: hypothetical protein LBS21_08585, partial [Clostridiales bacterium]|nr:hypothetical protein [Clostridiales bacterium]
MTIPRKFTFPYALTVPFRISPVITSIIILHQIISLAIAPIQVLVTAYFIDTALSVFNEGKPPELIIPPIIAFIAFNAYHRITAPLLELASKRREIKTRLALRVPFVQKRARLEFKHTENNDTADLINRVWEGPEYKISQMLENLTGFINMVGQTASYAVILIAGAPLAGSLLIVLSVPIFIISIKGGKQQYEANRETTKLSRTFWSLSWFLTAGIPASERNLFG